LFFLNVQSGRVVKLTTYLHVIPTLKIHRRLPPFPQHVFIAWCLIKQEIRLHRVVLS